MLYSKCDINFNAVGKTPATEIAEIVPTGTIESAAMELRLETAIDTFFIEHSHWEYESMALDAYTEACGDAAVLESNLTIIREADFSKAKNEILDKIKKLPGKIGGMITGCINSIMEKLSNSFLGSLAEKLKNAKRPKVPTIDIKANIEKLLKACNVFAIISKHINAIKSGKNTTIEDIKADVAKQTGGNTDGGAKEILNLEKKDEETTTSTKEQIFAYAKEIPNKVVSALKSAKDSIINCLKDLYHLVMDERKSKGATNIGWQIAQLLVVSAGIIAVTAMFIVNNIRRAANAITSTATDIKNAVTSRVNTKNIGDGATKDLDKDDIDTTATAV